MSLDKGAVYLLIFMFLFFVNTNAKIKVCFPYITIHVVSVGETHQTYMLGYALGPYE